MDASKLSSCQHFTKEGHQPELSSALRDSSVPSRDAGVEGWVSCTREYCLAFCFGRHRKCWHPHLCQCRETNLSLAPISSCPRGMRVRFPSTWSRPHRCLYQCTLASVYRKMHHACVRTPTVIKNGLQKHIRIRILPNGADGHTGLFSSRFFHDMRSSLSGILYILSGMHLCPIFRRQVSHRVYFTLSDHFSPLYL